jgi:hypothetical protein
MTDRRPTLTALRTKAQLTWGLIVLLLVALVFGATLALHGVVGHARRATLVAPVTLGPLRVVAAAAPGMSYEHLALDTSAGHLVALAGSVPSGCPPTGACAPEATATTFVVLDGATGARITDAPLGGAAAPAARADLLLADSTTHTAYAVAADEVTRFSTTNGQFEGGFVMPAALGGALTGGALDAAHSALALAGNSALVVVDAATGAVRASAAVPDLTAGPVLDPTTSRLFVLVSHSSAGTGGAMLLAFDASTLAQQGAITVPAGALGPLDTVDHALVLFGANGVTYRVALGGSLTVSAVTSDSDLRGATAAGWNATLGHLYRATPVGLEALDMRSGARLGTLPLTTFQPAAQPLLVDPARGLLYLPAAYGAVLIARDGQAGGINAATALLLARAALPAFLPDTNQDPPFVASTTFPVAADSTGAGLAHAYWIHFTNLGWQGPYPGMVGVSVVPDPQHPGGYLANFRIDWYQLFARSHTWTCFVAPDGTVLLRSDSGDAVP